MSQDDANNERPKFAKLPNEVSELLDKLIAGYQTPADLLGENGLLKQLTKAVMARALEAEMTHPLGYSKYAPEGKKYRQCPQWPSAQDGPNGFGRTDAGQSARPPGVV